ncbi:MAG TPA: hypothetical protein VNA88_17175 [Candidatus Kapabacteria bacterium]|jgi:hypothetical protein|nr:hypothetical protein [Candidatus Kapabacteria bacterium]
METEYSYDDLLEFLDHAGQRGIMPAASAGALASAARSILGPLEPQERANLRSVNVDAAIRRFTTKRAKDMTPSSLKVYGQRVRKALDYYFSWRDDPAGFAPATRASSELKSRRSGARLNDAATPAEDAAISDVRSQVLPVITGLMPNAYQTSLPIRPGHVVTISNIPHDLTEAEARRLGEFVRLLVVS